MRALVCRAFGLPSTLSVEQMPPPPLNSGEVRIRVHAAGVNYPDALLVQGLYQMKPPFPFIPGIEVAGTITEAAPDVTDRQVGQRVIGVVTLGGLAEEVCAPAAMTLPMLDDMTYISGAVFPVVYGTAHVALAHRAQLQPGETLLVLGAAGGVGLAAVELGKHMGATVIACASTDEKLALTRLYGAHHTINYTTQDIRETVRNLTDDRGVDVVFDPVGGDLFDKVIRVIAWEGRYLVIGFASGRIPEVAVNRVLLKNSAILGTFWGAYAANKPQVMAQSFQTLLGWYEQGAIKPYVSATYPLEQAADALMQVWERKALGKIAVVMDEA
ncbi:NADPH:quinone oxidoreductase family protein [Aggregatilineales bacterium SYSU G02658]